VGEVCERDALGDPPAQQVFETGLLCGRCAPCQHLRRGIVRQRHHVIDQRGGLVACVVGAVPEEDLRATQAPLRARDQLARGLGME
jgi:hypothetical protein